MALHIETALNISSAGTNRQASQLHIHNGLAYLRASSEHWESARCTLRMLEEIVHKTGLVLSGMDQRKFDLSSMSPFTERLNESWDCAVDTRCKMTSTDGIVLENHFPPSHLGNARTRFHSPAGPQVIDAEHSHGTTLADEDAERWLNELLSGNVLETESAWAWGDPV